ncbi:unnamed protein product [Rhizophagus irregularis]|nr:unnamed protein product [Rhizophagus irregularis]
MIGLVNKEIAIILKEIATTDKEISITNKIFEGKIDLINKEIGIFDGKLNLINKRTHEKGIDLENWSSSYPLCFKFMCYFQ